MKAGLPLGFCPPSLGRTLCDLPPLSWRQDGCPSASALGCECPCSGPIFRLCDIRYAALDGFRVVLGKELVKHLFGRLDWACHMESIALRPKNPNVSATQEYHSTEFLNTCQDKLNCRNSHYFGPVGEDRRHIAAAGITWDVLGGFRLSQLWRFETPTPIGLNIPELGIAGSSAIFTTDRLGTGSNGGGSPFASLIPGIDMNQFGRSVNSWSDLNAKLAIYNNTVAGTLTPAGQALVKAGIFTPAQLVALGAVSPKIPLVPTTNPWPFENLFNVDLGITRPTKLFGEKITVVPWLQIFNVFNNNSLGTGTYGGLGGTFGSLNYPYQPSDIPVLNSGTRLRQKSTRLMQIGVRVTF